jgi:hypothetical protein
LEEAEVRLLRSEILVFKQQLEDYVRIEWDMERENINQLIDRNDYFLSLDKKNVKMMTSRVRGFRETIAN